MIVDASVWVAIFRENAALAASCKLRGADAVLVALAEALDQPLITLDREIRERSSRIIEAQAPDAWVLRQSSG
jgi:predicted nucleic acid-binding protein